MERVADAGGNGSRVCSAETVPVDDETMKTQVRLEFLIESSTPTRYNNCGKPPTIIM
jgi:hypothetical protein